MQSRGAVRGSPFTVRSIGSDASVIGAEFAPRGGELRGSGQRTGKVKVAGRRPPPDTTTVSADTAGAMIE